MRQRMCAAARYFFRCRVTHSPSIYIPWKIFRAVIEPRRTMKIITHKVLRDNYMYFIIDTTTRDALVVDAGDVSDVLRIERRDEFSLKAALVTHHHWDHAQGLETLVKQFPSLTVIGADKSTIPTITHPVIDGEVVRFGSLAVSCIHTPGHTRDHVCYYVVDKATDQKALFTGDTLFLGGCGKLFECPAAVMYDSLYNKLLPHVDDHTEMYFGHEYSLTNLKFAKNYEPQSARIAEKMEQVKQQLSNGLPTTPSLWADEKTYNPFLRAETEVMRNYFNTTDGIKILERLRAAKDNFKP